MDILTVIERGLLSLLTLFLITRLIGKKQVSELSLFDYVIGISIGNFAAEITINTDVPLIHGIVAVIVFGIVAFLVSVITMKSIILRRMIIGVPTILVQDGKLIKKNLSKSKFDVNDFLEECRSSGYFDLNEIRYAILETSGKISFMPKADYKPLTPKDMKLKLTDDSLQANVVIDGHIMNNNLKNMKKEKSWLEKELKVKGVKLNEILLANLDDQEKLTIYKKNENIEVLNVLE